MVKLRIPAAALGAGLVLAACGSGGHVATTNPSASAAAATARLTSLVRDSRTKAIEARTAKVTGTVSTTLASGAPQTIHLEGALDFPAHRAQTTVTVPSLGAIKVVLDGTTIYESIPKLAPMLGAKPWLKVDPAAIAKATGNNELGQLLESVLQSSSADPGQEMSYLAGVTGTVKTLGTENIRGTSTTHYQFTTDLSKALQDLPAEQQAALQKVMDQIGVTTAPVAAWIDGAGLLRRMHVALTFSPTATSFAWVPANLLPKSSDLTMEIYDFGARVTIEVPPPGQVTDLGDLLNQLEQ